ncbi:hypothetical protein CSUI_006541, partial [Cystoisospora suis]
MRSGDTIHTPPKRASSSFMKVQTPLEALLDSLNLSQISRIPTYVLGLSLIDLPRYIRKTSFICLHAIRGSISKLPLVYLSPMHRVYLSLSIYLSQIYFSLSSEYCR